MKDISVKVKMYIMVFIALIPMITVQVITIVSTYKHKVDLELKASEDFSNAVSISFQNYLDKIWYAELLIGKYAIEHDFDIKGTEKYLRECMSDTLNVSIYSWVNPNGIIAASTDDKASGLNLTDREYIKQIVNGEEKVVSDLLIGKIYSKPTLLIARGIRANGELKGIVTARVDADKFDMVLPKHKSGQTSLFGIIDRQGMIVYMNGTSDIPFDQRRVKSDSPVWEALHGKVSIDTSFSQSRETDSRMGASCPIAGIGWASFATISTQEVFEKTNRDLLNYVIVMFISASLLFILNMYLTNNIIYPVNVLQKAANAISRKDFSVRTNLKGKDEFGQASRAFDNMVEQIQELECNRQLFLHVAAHELRNPMTCIKGIASLIHQKMVKGKAINNLEELIEALNKEISRLALLLNQIIDAFRVQSENVQIKENFKPLDINEVIKDAAKVYQLDTTSNRSIVVVGCRIALVLGDSERLADVIRNLISNAIKYSEEMTEIRIKTYVVEDNVIISVKDQGIGIPKDQLARIFSGFCRIKNEGIKDPGGMGLGLYICKDIVMRHAGSIWAENNDDKGSTFYIKLPLYKV